MDTYLVERLNVGIVSILRPTSAAIISLNEDSLLPTAEWCPLDFRIDAMIDLPTVVTNLESTTCSKSYQPESTVMGAARAASSAIMDDVSSPIYNSDAEGLMMDDFSFSGLCDEEFFPPDNNITDEMDFSSEEASDLKNDSEVCNVLSTSSLVRSSYEYEEDCCVDLDEFINICNPQQSLISVPRSTISQGQQAVRINNTSKSQKSVNLKLELSSSPHSIHPAAITAPSTPELVNNILDLETETNQPIMTEKLMEPTLELATINMEALIDDHLVLFPSLPCAVSVPSLDSTVSRPGTSCSSLSRACSPPAPASPMAGRRSTNKRPRDKSDSFGPSETDIKKQKNNEASRKSRQRRKERIQDQSHSVTRLENENRTLLLRLAELEKLRDQLKNHLLQSVPSTGAG